MLYILDYKIYNYHPSGGNTKEKILGLFLDYQFPDDIENTKNQDQCE